jgi:hypothetical protein
MLLFCSAAAAADEPVENSLPHADAHEAQLMARRKEKELLDIELDIAQRRKALAALDADANTAPTAPSFPRLIRMMQFDSKQFGEFAVGKATVRAEAGDYINSTWILKRFDRNAAILANTNTGAQHIAVLGAAAVGPQEAQRQPPPMNIPRQEQ